MHVEIFNTKKIGTGRLSQQVVDTCSSSLGVIFFKHFPRAFVEINGHASIDDKPLSKKEKILVLACVTLFGIFVARMPF